MSDRYYRFVWHLFNPAFWVSSSPTVINAEVTRRSGAYIIAANHLSPLDVPLIIRHAKRNLDFLSIVEVFRNPLVAWFYTGMNTFALDRSRPDASTVRILLERLKRGRVVAMFPEGRIRSEEDSVLNGGKIRPGIGRIVVLAKVPVIPCVVLNSKAYLKFYNWLPLKRTKYRLIFGEPIEVDATMNSDEAASEFEMRLCAEFRRLYEELTV